MGVAEFLHRRFHVVPRDVVEVLGKAAGELNSRQESLPFGNKRSQDRFVITTVQPGWLRQVVGGRFGATEKCDASEPSHRLSQQTQSPLSAEEVNHEIDGTPRRASSGLESGF